MTRPAVFWPFSTVPYEVQERALEKAKGRPGFAYFLEMGLGKTAVTLAEFVSLHGSKRVDTLVVICANANKANWVDEINKMSAPLTYHVWPCPVANTVEQVRVYIMNYEATITRNGQNHLLWLLNRRGVMLVLDESVHIKNYKARRTKVLIAASGLAKVTRILSGKPVVQGPHDLWAQLRFINAHNGMTYFVFRNTFCKMGGYMAKQVVGVQEAERLYKMVDSSGFRARKADWIDLPEKIYTTKEVELTPKQKQHYRELYNDLFTIVQDQEIVAPMAMTALLKMQQVVSGFIISGKMPIEIEGINPKLNVLLETLEEIEGKVIIFCYFRYSVQKILVALGTKAVGMMEGLDSAASAKYFNTDPKIRYLVAQVQTGKYGHTLLGGKDDDRCHTTIFYENSYSLDARAQAEDRNHRIGQDRAVGYIDFIASALDKDIIGALQRKEHIAQEVVDNIRSGRDAGFR